MRRCCNSLRTFAILLSLIAGHSGHASEPALPLRPSFSQTAIDSTDAYGAPLLFSPLMEFTRLLGSRWFVGGCVCEYNGGVPGFDFYGPRPKEPRTGVRNPDFTERAALFEVFQKVHLRKHPLKLELMK